MTQNKKDSAENPAATIKRRWQIALHKLQRIGNTGSIENRQQKAARIYREAGWESFMHRSQPIARFSAYLTRKAAELLACAEKWKIPNAKTVWDNWGEKKRVEHLRSVAELWVDGLGLPTAFVTYAPNTSKSAGCYQSSGQNYAQGDVYIYNVSGNYDCTMRILAHELLGHGSQYALIGDYPKIKSGKIFSVTGFSPLELNLAICIFRHNTQLYKSYDPTLAWHLQLTGEDDYFVQPKEVHAWAIEDMFIKWRKLLSADRVVPQSPVIVTEPSLRPMRNKSRLDPSIPAAARTNGRRK